MAAHAHAGEPFASHDGQGNGVFFVENVHRCKCPSVHFESFAVQGGSVAVTFVVGVCLDDGAVFQVFLHQGLDPSTWDDVGTVLFTSVEFYGHFAFNLAIHLFVGFNQSVG